jgi:hypothetical protein
VFAVTLVAVMLAPTLTVAAILGSLSAARWLARRRRMRISAARGPSVRPLERIAADVRRLHAAVESDRLSCDPAVPVVRRRATRLAYEDCLDEACQALGVEHRLPELTGRAREVELLRVEAALTAAGLAPHARPAGVPDVPGIGDR